MRRTINAIAVIAATLFGAALIAPAAGATGSRMQITFIAYDSPGADNGSNYSVNQEYVTISNTSGDRISVAGWHLYDRDGHAYTLPSISLAGHSKIRIHTGTDSNSDVDKYWGLAYYVWNNSGDRARLRDNKNGLVSQCSWSVDGKGYKAC